jgi:hypothetical protein
MRTIYLVERSLVDNDIKIVGIIDWEFSRTGSLLELFDYPWWIYETEIGPCEVPSDEVLQENRENQDLRAYFRDKMVAIFGDKSGLLLDMNVQDKRIELLECMFLRTHEISDLKGCLEEYHV